MGQVFVRHGLSAGAKMGHGVGQISRVPIDDSGDDQVEPGGAILLGFRSAIRDAALLERADRLGQGVALLAFVQSGMAAPAVLSQTLSDGRQDGRMARQAFMQRGSRTARRGRGEVEGKPRLSFAHHMDHLNPALGGRGASRRFEAEHPTDPALDTLVILLDPVVEIRALPCADRVQRSS